MWYDGSTRRFKMKVRTSTEVMQRLKQVTKLLNDGGEISDETKVILRTWLVSLKWYLGIFHGKM